MTAETVYNVANSLPPAELERLVIMLNKHKKPVDAKAQKKKDDVEEIWTKAECYEAVWKLLNDRKKNKIKAANH